MSRGTQITPADIGPDTPLRLETAAQIAFPGGGMTVSGLRKERDRKRLVVEKIAGKEFTTLRNIERMREQCRAPQKVLASGSNPKSETLKESSSGGPRSSFETERAKSARAALEQTAKGLSKPSPSTSPKNTQSRGTANVILLKS
jgi:hypothetical protein